VRRIGQLLVFCTLACTGAELKPETFRAFEIYIRTTEARVQERLTGQKQFLWTDDAADRRRQVREGQIAIEQTPAAKIPNGLIHDWTGAVFIPGTTVAKTLALVQDYGNHKNVYKPEVIDSKLLSRQGNDFKVYLRLLKKKVLTVVLNTQHDVHYFRLDDNRWHSRSYTTRIAEVENAGKRDETEKPPDHGNGFLWRLDSYWRFAERDGGVYLECEAVSLTRDVPTGLGWLIEPIIRNLPRESLANTLQATRAALVR
jgi:hypothetical protein